MLKNNTIYDTNDIKTRDKGRSPSKIAAIVGMSARILEKIRTIKEPTTINPDLYSDYWQKANSQKTSID